MSERDAAALAGWRRLESAARETGNDALAEQAKHFADLLEASDPPTES